MELKTVEITLHCDRCAESGYSVAAKFASNTLGEARLKAQRHDWAFLGNDKHLCPKCKAKKK